MEYSEASSKKSRKPYTLTKARESWSNDENERFIKALQLYNRDWKKIETYVGTKTVVQIRSHAQKYFQKIMKSGITDAIPPPRPKRRASDPPHGASCHPEAKHMRLQPDAPSRQGSGKDDDSDDGMQVHHNHTGHQPQQQHHHLQQQHHQQQHSKQHEMLEPSAQLEASRALISCQGLQHVYLYMASLFTQPPVDSAGMLQRLSTRDRHVLAVLMKSLVEELNHQQHTHQHSHPHSDPQQHPEAHLQQLQEDEQHQEQLHHSGSGGHSNGATVNTTAGTGPAHTDAAAAAAAQAAGAAAASAGTQPGTGAAAGAAEAAAGEEAGQQAVVSPHAGTAAGLPQPNGPGFLEEAQPVWQQQEAEGLPVSRSSRLQQQQQQQHPTFGSPQEQQQPLHVASPAADADQPLEAGRRPASSSPPMDAPVAGQAGSPAAGGGPAAPLTQEQQHEQHGATHQG